jgi:hypothetical protein
MWCTPYKDLIRFKHKQFIAMRVCDFAGLTYCPALRGELCLSDCCLAEKSVSSQFVNLALHGVKVHYRLLYAKQTVGALKANVNFMLT